MGANAVTANLPRFVFREAFVETAAQVGFQKSSPLYFLNQVYSGNGHYLGISRERFCFLKGFRTFFDPFSLPRISAQGETAEIAEEMAARDALRRIFR